MVTCPKCNHLLEAGSAFCNKCGTKIDTGSPPIPQAQSPVRAAVPSAPRRKPIARLLPFVMGPIMLGVFAFMFMGKGCSSTKGSFVSTGAPFGNFTFTPSQCRSGQRMGFHGAVLLGNGPTDGAVVAFEDPMYGTMVKVEIPGSCRPPDYEVCTEIVVDKRYCPTFDVSVRRTNTEVNRVRLVEGYMRLACRFAEGGTISASINYEGCD